LIYRASNIGWESEVPRGRYVAGWCRAHGQYRRNAGTLWTGGGGREGANQGAEGAGRQAWREKEGLLNNRGAQGAGG
jgi:hypothetical protein